MATSATFFTFSNTINGEARTSPRLTQAVNPSNKQRLWDVPVASEADVDEAVAAAKQAFPSWSRTPWSERARLLAQAREALLAIKDDMASVIMQENGKPVGASNYSHANRSIHTKTNADPVRADGGGSFARVSVFSL